MRVTAISFKTAEMSMMMCGMMMCGMRMCMPEMDNRRRRLQT